MFSLPAGLLGGRRGPGLQVTRPVTAAWDLLVCSHVFSPSVNFADLPFFFFLQEEMVI